ncbi:MAG: hypothetical protein ACRD1K_15280 [Acidimicrobiales bacterium]
MTPERWTALAALAESQCALVTTAQADALGIRSDARQRAIEAGLLVPVRRGVLRVQGSPMSRWEDLMAACLAAGSVACRRSAALLHGLPVMPPDRPEIVGTDTATDELAATGRHRTRRLAPEHCTLVEQVPCTTIERTIIDLAWDSSRYVLASLIGDADRRRLCRPADIDLTLGQMTTRGRHGITTLREILADHVGGASALEATWLRHLRDAGLPAAVLQHQLVVRNRVILLDSAWPGQRVALEVDGWDAHRTRNSFDSDADRGNLLLEAGWRVVHATSRSDPGRVTAQLRRLLDP